MSWRIEWRAISNRIQGFSQASKIFLQFKNAGVSDPYSAAKKELLPHAQAILKEIIKFYKTYEPILTKCANDLSLPNIGPR
jgi:hypothetical protein